MKAIAISQPGDPDVLVAVDVDMPAPASGEVLIRVAAAGVNRPDCLQRAGRYPVPADANPLPGLEVAGIVEACGDGCTRFAPGDRVMALTHGGGYAEYCVVDERHCLPVPDSLSLIEAAAIPETTWTVWSNVWMRAALQPGERLLVHGGSSGIGTTAVQLARALGHEVAITAGSDLKCEFCSALGATVAINYREGQWVEHLREHWPHCDVILDMVGASYWSDNLSMLAQGGRLALIALIGGARAEQLDLLRVLTGHLTITGSTLRPQSVEQKAAITQSLEPVIFPLLDTGGFAPVIFECFELESAANAHTLMESGEHMGKIVLTVDRSL